MKTFCGFCRRRGEGRGTLRFPSDWTLRQVSSACVYGLKAPFPAIKRSETHAFSLFSSTKHTQHARTKSGSVNHQTHSSRPRRIITARHVTGAGALVLSPFNFIPSRHDPSRLWRGGGWNATFEERRRNGHGGGFWFRARLLPAGESKLKAVSGRNLKRHF